MNLPTSITQLRTLEVRAAGSGVAVVTIRRESSANTISAGLSRELLTLARTLEHLSDVRAVVLTGAGRFFCAGADLRDPEHGPGWLDLGRRAFDALAELPLPTIAAVNGPALGGGTELALACDFRIASTSAVFGLPEIKIGALPAAGGLTRLQEVVGPTVAREWIFTGRKVSPDEARDAGLVSDIVDGDNLLKVAISRAEEMSQYAGYALRTAKSILLHSAGTPSAHALQTEYRLVDTMATPEQVEQERRNAARRDPTYARIFGMTAEEVADA